MSDYLIIQKTRQKINIVSAAREYKLPVGVYSVHLDVFYESLLIYMIYAQKDDRATVKEIMWSFPKARPEEIRAFIVKFKEEHVVEDMKYGYGRIPCIATEDKSMQMRSESFKHPIYITLEQEEQFIDAIKSPGDGKKDNLIRLFIKFCNDYRIHARTKALRETEGEELASLFCQIHGVDMYNMVEYLPSYRKEDKESKGSTFGQALLVWCIISVYVIIAAGFIELGLHTESYWLSFIWYTIGICMLCGGFSKLFGHN